MTVPARPHKTDVVIGLTGRAGSGKDTAADHLCRNYGFERASFAEALKVMLEALFAHVGIDHRWLHEPGLKNLPIPELDHMASARTLMQTLGTEWGRDRISPELWIYLLDRHLGLSAGRPVHDRIVITDVRMLNEALWVRQTLGGHLIRLQRDRVLPMGAAASHESESWAQTLEVDTEIRNDGLTHTTLHHQLDALMDHLQIDQRPPLTGFGRDC